MLPGWSQCRLGRLVTGRIERGVRDWNHLDSVAAVWITSSRDWIWRWGDDVGGGGSGGEVAVLETNVEATRQRHGDGRTAAVPEGERRSRD
ncbi:hypothetical protein E2562_007420 [Oryza meyeriana var. granulata]|uniref:Uncharacterized protein n=1 Tax=Oryza meyeriana var. granulata TaxID=110450 RepID=A0A6G1CZZ0_9ORYZ|nr:hypothetical protein E2562_007420 [Oryza meyeriana var. granulata]